MWMPPTPQRRSMSMRPWVGCAFWKSNGPPLKRECTGISRSWAMARSRLYPPSVDPGLPTLGRTPDGWQRVPFKDVVEVVERPIALAPAAKYRLLTAKRSRGGIELRCELAGREIL